MLTYATSLVRAAFFIALRRTWCPWSSAWSAARHRSTQLALRARLAASAHIVEEDGEAVLWEIAGERYWLPCESCILPGMLAEQKLGLYDSDGHGVRPGDIALDCGANVGVYTLRALASGAAHVVAIEPAPRNLTCLRRNLAEAVQAGRVTIVPKGLWDRDDLLTLREVPRNSAADSVALHMRGSRKGPTVPVTTIDAIVRELGLPRIDYIKMDVEGAEYAALRGAAGTIRRFHPRMVIATEHRFDDPREIPRAVTAITDGYSLDRGPCVDAGNALRPATLLFAPAEPQTNGSVSSTSERWV